MKKMGVTALVALMALGACSKAEPRSTEYFAAHLDEARQIVQSCRDGATRGEECTNADYAVQEADAKERLRKFFKK
ncbi:EexN family lipoprotein [Sphingomonas sp. OTU376]|uniref:EexN family lipoprotein n=1 Tax=Sphingomonas sp. OTU376 TaxID=3043863 RepID=UPI00313E4E51